MQSQSRASGGDSKANASRRSPANDLSSLGFRVHRTLHWTKPGEEAYDAEPAAFSSSIKANRSQGRDAKLEDGGLRKQVDVSSAAEGIRVVAAAQRNEFTEM
ncbi:hypothetical protein PLANPX_2576 [Lacipirellula parvula]|uniref:Uncharacterized protein n=1 Tax=Lacipirellula parvula TaxID=2650471 RepID=A0A5K7X850_9BACT|nr:hypothetical protein PLANPX_2576 [Lacipirellula parvula]